MSQERRGEPSGVSKQRVTKLDAARRQLRTAVHLYFANGDDVSIHTLTAAGRQILLDIIKSRGEKAPFQEFHETALTPEGQRIFAKAIAAAENFFKHADRDTASEFDFNPETTGFLLMEAGAAYQQVTGRVLRELWVFTIWFSIKYPNILRPDATLRKALNQLGKRIPQESQRALFFDTLNKPTLFPNLD